MSSIFDSYEVVIGLECHVQLLTQTKLFSPAPNHYGDAPNTNIDIVDIALPGVLPVLNERAIDFALRLGLALSCQINKQSVFARKHYFYPDLPKGYQISQFDQPICGLGRLEIKMPEGIKSLGIERIHIEEDAGKNLHVEGGNTSFVDYNRAGTPLLEVVTKPDMRSAAEAMEAVKTLRALVTYLGVCDGNMQEGSMRADVNVSVRKRGSDKLGTRTETKNLNSVKFLGQAIEYEMRRQILELEAGRVIVQETRLWDSNRKESRSLRSKEEAHDYRYFPDPDLLPLIIPDQQIDLVRSQLPELPFDKEKRFVEVLGLNPYDAAVLTSDKEIANYFESALAVHNNAKGIANWVINEVLRVVKSNGDDDQAINISACSISPNAVGKLVQLIDNKVISGKIAKVVFEDLLQNPLKSPEQIVDEKGLRVEKDEGMLIAVIQNVISEFANEVQKYKSGKTQVFGFLMGQVMKQTKGKAAPEEANALLKKILDEEK